MIDTNKYKGHTKGGWGIEPNGWQVYAYVGHDICRIGGSPNGRVDAQLIADAPLLLEEVKRLRKGIRGIIGEMQEWTEDQVGKPLFRMFIDELKEVIE
jgi:hypothetical protein